MRPSAPPVLDLGRHGARNDIARSEILQVRRVALHKALATLVEKVTTFSAHAFGDQHPCARDTCRVKLPELHVLQRDTGARRHAQAVAGADERVGRGGENAPRPAGREKRRARVQDHHFAGFHLERGHAQHLAARVSYEVERHPLDEELRARPDVSLVKRMQHRVAGAVRGAAGALHGPFAEILRMAAERPLVNRAVLVAIERHAEMLQLVYELGCFAHQEFDRVLVAEPVRALHRVVHVPQPRVLAHVAERRADPALRRHRVRARREHLGKDRDAQPRLRQLQGGAQPGAARADDYHVEVALRDRHFRSSRGSASPSRRNRRAKGWSRPGAPSARRCA